jgi:hemolysin activation/secretion protein
MVEFKQGVTAAIARRRLRVVSGLSGATLSVAVAGIATGVAAQAAPQGPGSIAQVPPPPQAPDTVPDIRIERRGSVADNGPTGPEVVVSTLHISGATRFPEATLVAVTGFKPGSSLTIADLRRMAAQVSTYYNTHGYPVAQAYVPAQAVDGGAVTIAVVEGHYGKVALDNQSRLRDGVARGILAGVGSGDIIYTPPLDRRLLIMSDVPGVQVKSSLAPGAAVGTSDLTVDLKNAPLISGNVQVDNDGDPYTGRWRGGGTLNLNDPLGIGDQATVRYLTSGSGLQYVRGSYQAQVADATVGAAYEYFSYNLGPQYGASDINGSEQIASLYASYPLIRTHDDTLRLLGDLDYRFLHNSQDTPSLEGDRHAVVGTLGLTGQHVDHFGGGGTDAYSVSVSVGDLDIESASALAADAVTSRTQGDYAVFRGSVDRLQNIGGPFQLYGWVRGQAASRNLDIDEKIELGGAYAVRAYPEGEAYGDEGLIGTVEARMWLPKPWARMPGRLQLAVFEDAGTVRFAVNPWLPGPDTANRAGGGVGVTWSDPNNFLVRLSYAHRTGTPPATSYPDNGGEIRFEAVKFF